MYIVYICKYMYICIYKIFFPFIIYIKYTKKEKKSPKNC